MHLCSCSKFGEYYSEHSQGFYFYFYNFERLVFNIFHKFGKLWKSLITNTLESWSCHTAKAIWLVNDGSN